MQNKLVLALIVLLLIPSANALLGDADRDGSITSADMVFYNTILNGKAGNCFLEDCPSPYGKNLDMDGDWDIGVIDKSILNLILVEKSDGSYINVCRDMEKRWCMGNAPAEVNVVDLVSESTSGSFSVEVRNKIWAENDYGVLGNQVYGVETQETVPAGVTLNKEDNLTNPPQLCPDGQVCTNPYINYTYTMTEPGVFGITIKTVEQHLNVATTLPSVETMLTLVSDFDEDGYDYTVDCDDANPEYTTDCDLDDDGYNYTVDCNDSDYWINPGVEEYAGNGIDEDCDGADQVIDGHVDDGANMVYGTSVSLICDYVPWNYYGMVMASMVTGGIDWGYYLFNIVTPFTNCYMSASKSGYDVYDSASTFDIGVGFRTEDITLTENTIYAGYFTGTVKNDATYVGIPNAYVKMTKTDTGELMQVVKTDAGGNFLIKGVPTGYPYNLSAENPGCTMSFGPTGLTVTPGAPPTDAGLILMTCP